MYIHTQPQLFLTTAPCCGHGDSLIGVRTTHTSVFGCCEHLLSNDPKGNGIGATGS